MLQHPDLDKTDFSHMEKWFTSASPISAELLAKGAKYIGDNFLQLYGTSETALLGTVIRPQEVALEGLAFKRLTSIGRPCLGYQVKIVHDYDNELGLGETGETRRQGMGFDFTREKYVLKAAREFAVGEFTNVALDFDVNTTFPSKYCKKSKGTGFNRSFYSQGIRRTGPEIFSTDPGFRGILETGPGNRPAVEFPDLWSGRVLFLWH